MCATPANRCPIHLRGARDKEKGYKTRSKFLKILKPIRGESLRHRLLDRFVAVAAEHENSTIITCNGHPVRSASGLRGQDAFHHRVDIETEMITVLLADDHELVRMGFRRLLEDAPGIRVVGEADSGEEAVNLARSLEPDVILMDVRMPGIGGLEATRKITNGRLKSRVIAVTALEDDPFPQRLLSAGASGYLTKDAGFDQMVEAIHAVHEGQLYLTPNVARQIAVQHLSKKPAGPWDSLSDREMQVMLMITTGQTVQDIADKLCLSPKTVNSYRYRLFEKLGVHNDVELTLFAIRHGLTDDR